MPEKSYKNQLQICDIVPELSNIIDEFNRIVDAYQLVDLAIELSEEYSEKSFDRIALLLECYAGLFNCHREEMSFALGRLHQQLPCIVSNTIAQQQCDNA